MPIQNLVPQLELRLPGKYMWLERDFEGEPEDVANDASGSGAATTMEREKTPESKLTLEAQVRLDVPDSLSN